MEDDADHFIRGRVRSTKAASAVTEKRVAAPRESDSLFGTRRDAADERPRKRKASRGDAEAASKKRKTVLDLADASSSITSSSSPAHVDVMTFRHLQLGQTLLGCVRSVSELEVLLALPNGHSGHLALREVSAYFQRLVDDFLQQEPSPAAEKNATRAALPDLHALFTPGQLLPVAILALTTPAGARRVELTMRVEVVNAQLTAKALSAGMRVLGSVASVEERGYAVHLGVSDAQMTGFLPFAEAPGNDSDKSASTSRDGTEEKSEEQEDDEEEGEGEEAAPRLIVGQPIVCVVRAMTGRAVTLTARASALQATVSSASPSQHLQSILPSSLFSLTVSSVTSHGLLCFTPTFSATVDLTHLPSLPSTSSNLSLLYKPGSTATACVLYVNPATKVVACSLNPNLVRSASAVAPARVGEWVTAKVWRVEEKIGVYFHCERMDRDTATALFSASSPPSAPADDAALFIAFAPLSRLADGKVANVAKSFRVSSLHLARVSSFDPLASLVHVTLQPATLSRAVMSLDDVHPGMEVSGTIASFHSFGLLVQLSPNIRALVPVLHYADIPLSDPRKVYKKDQRVKARVLYVDPKARRVLLTLKKTLVNSPHPLLTSLASAEVGRALHGWVAAAERVGLLVETYNAVKGRVSLKALVRDGYLQEGEEDEVAKRWRKGDVVAVRITTVQRAKRRLFFSLKLTADVGDGSQRRERSRSKAATDSSHPSSPPPDRSVKVGAVVNGRVTRLLKGNGLLVALAGGETGRVHVCDLSDDWVKDWEGAHKAGERIRVRVAAIKEEEGGKKQIDLVLKDSALRQVSPPTPCTHLALMLDAL